MAGSKARTHWARGGRWVRLFLLGLWSPPPLPAAAARPPTARSLASDPGSRGVGKGGGRGGPRPAAPGLRTHRLCPHLRSPPHTPSSSPASLGLCPLPSAKAPGTLDSTQSCEPVPQWAPTVYHARRRAHYPGGKSVQSQNPLPGRLGRKEAEGKLRRRQGYGVGEGWNLSEGHRGAPPEAMLPIPHPGARPLCSFRFPSLPSSGCHVPGLHNPSREDRVDTRRAEARGRGEGET